MSHLVDGVQLLMALAFLSAGATKIVASRDFEASLYAYNLLPPTTVRFATRLLPVAEVVLGAWWLTTSDTLITVPTLSALVVFAAAATIVVRRGRRIGCGCSGLFASRPAGWTTVLRNALLAGSIVGWSLLVQQGAVPLARLPELGLVSGLVLAAAWATLLAIVILGAEECLTLELARRSVARRIFHIAPVNTAP